MAKILIAEDEPATRRILVHYLQRLGHTTIQSSDGQRALQILEDNPDIDLLVSDVQMPNMTGLELIRTLRSNDRYSRLPVLITSAVVSIREVQDHLRAGASAFIPKPIQEAHLRRYVSELISAPQPSLA